MAAYTGQITVTTAGTAVQGPDVEAPAGWFIVTAHPSNTGLVAFGNDGENDVTLANGHVLSAGQLTPLNVKNLKTIWFDSAVNGEKFTWQQG